MKIRLVRSNQNIADFEYLDDCKRIRQVLYDNGNWEATLVECQTLWEWYSDSMAAGWMRLPEDDDELYECISYYIEEEE